jgi:hypothetical protein
LYGLLRLAANLARSFAENDPNAGDVFAARNDDSIGHLDSAAFDPHDLEVAPGHAVSL